MAADDACMAFGFNLGYWENLPERWQDQGSPNDCFELDVLVTGRLSFLSESVRDQTEEQRRRFRRVREQLQWSFPIDVFAHGRSFQRPMFFIAVRGAVYRTDDGNPLSFDASDLVVSKFQVAQLREYCAAHGIRWQEPKWHLLLDQLGA
ncbi:MAG TPA: hypothetical protein VIM12_00545 [Noviherbaspirillum sp.]|jgi:hypothetical protein|uniref:hypothetical protein n=1 Tax=Noviherbaspirillum sp. TaxID=1926288 RepID=UPI002F95A739